MAKECKRRWKVLKARGVELDLNEYIWSKRGEACNGKRIARMIKRDEKYMKPGVALEMYGNEPLRHKDWHGDAL